MFSRSGHDFCELKIGQEAHNMSVYFIRKFAEITGARFLLRLNPVRNVVT